MTTKTMWRALVLLAAIGCGGGQKPTTATETGATSEPVQRPASPLVLPHAEAPAGLFAVAAIGNPAGTVERLRAFLHAFEPGAAGGIDLNVLDQVLGVTLSRPEAIVGIDHAKPLYVLLLDPELTPVPLAVVAAVEDETALRQWVEAAAGQLEIDVREGYAAIASAGALNLVAEYALGPMRAKPAPRHPTITVFMQPVLEAYRAEVDQFFDEVAAEASAGQAAPSMQRAMSWYVDGLRGLVGQLEAATIALEIDGEQGSAVLGLVGSAGSKLAGFSARQRPCDYALTRRLALGDAAIVFGGEMDWEPIREQLVAISVAALPGAEGNQAIHDAYMQWMKLYTGEVVLSMDVGDAFTVVSAFEIDEGVDALAATRHRIIEIDRAGTPMHYKEIGIPAFEHAGVPVDEYELTVSFDELPEPQRAEWQRTFGAGVRYTAATLAGVHVNVMARDARARTKALLSALAAAPGEPAQAVARRAAASRERNESIFGWLDIGRLAGQAGAPAAMPPGTGIDLGIGFAEDGMLVRVTTTAATLRALTAATQPPPPAPNPQLVNDIAALADRACACKDMVCAEQVQQDLMDRVEHAREPTIEEQEQIMEMMERMGRCFAEIAE